MNKTITVIVITALLLVGCILVASAGTIGSQRVQVRQAEIAATTDARRVEVASTMEAEKARAAQIRETYEGQAEVIGAQADAYVQKHGIDMAFYALEKSEDRQDEMLYFVLNGESRQKTEIRTATVVIWSFAGIVVVFVGAIVVSANWAQIVGIFVALRELA
ncbi:MAG: hypothetical protein JXA89_24175, partial [Anaerolineae bacterium]|nr:hypothetical protein [Anaerolineae bacterium]